MMLRTCGGSGILLCPLPVRKAYLQTLIPWKLWNHLPCLSFSSFYAITICYLCDYETHSFFSICKFLKNLRILIVFAFSFRVPICGNFHFWFLGNQFSVACFMLMNILYEQIILHCFVFASSCLKLSLLIHLHPFLFPS